MGRGWRPLAIGGAVVVGTFALAQAQIFAPSAPAGGSAPAGNAIRGEAVFQRECAGCHGDAGAGGGVGPQLAGSGLESSDVAAAVQEGRGVMPPGLVTGQEQADVVAYVVSVAQPSQ